MARLFQLERKFENNTELKNKYVSCIDEYIKLGHMKRVYTSDDSLKDNEGNFNCYYMPHHAVFKQTSNTTKLRVVSDASRKTHSGFSLNDKLCVGPTIQDDLFDIFIRWRKYKYVFTADSEKMYRQVNIHREHHDYQRILWRDDPKKPIRDYCLTTATFGSAYASHSSIRALQQFDPIGWLAPGILKGKLLLKELWKLKLDWDEIVPLHITEEWNKINSELHIIKDISIPRWISNLSQDNKIEIHGFCDASNDGYAAIVYFKTIKEDDVNISLVAAKTKIAPMKTISIPRLELCGALLLSQLITKIKKTMDLIEIPTFAHSDSEITLAWIKGDPHKYNTFVANRITEIQKNNLNWNYVNTKINPADIASRGAYPHELDSNALWWTGPDWLKQSNTIVSNERFSTNLEIKKKEIINLATLTVQNEIYSINNNLNKLIKIIAYCKRFINNCKVTKNERKTGILSVNEFENALLNLIQIDQKEYFKEEISCIKNNKNIYQKKKYVVYTLLLMQIIF